MSMHEKEKWGGGGESEAGLGWAQLWPDGHHEWARREPGLESHSSTAIPIVNWKRNPSKLCYCLLLCMIFPAPSGPVESARFAPSLKVKPPRVQKPSARKKKRAEGILSRHVSGEQYTACRGKTGISERLQRRKKKEEKHRFHISLKLCTLRSYNKINSNALQVFKRAPCQFNGLLQNSIYHRVQVCRHSYIQASWDTCRMRGGGGGRCI